MKLDVAMARIPDAAEVEAPRPPGDGAKQADCKVRFAAAMGRARGESEAKAEPGVNEAETAAGDEPEAKGKTRKKRASVVPAAMLPFDVTVRPEKKLVLLPEGEAVAGAPLPGAGALAPAPALTTAALLPPLPGAIPAAPAQPHAELPASAKAGVVPTVPTEVAKPERPDVREPKDGLAKPVERPEADPKPEAGKPEAAKPDAKSMPRESSTVPRAEPATAARLGQPARDAQPKAAEREAEPVAEKPRAVRADTTAARPTVALGDFTRLREPATVAMKPEVMPALPRQLVEPTPMLTAANLAQAVVTLPDLGRIEIRSRMQDGALEIDLRADRAEGRAALESAREALTVQVAAIAPVAQIVVGPTQVNATDGARPGHAGMLSDSSQQPRDPGGRDSSGGSRERGGHREESHPVAQMTRGRVRIVL